ncbi:MAG TPA: NAD-dependent epimerase/dehydratase family protein [Flavisolibacter sp.]|nr:NAD-dependent epimerase/dehydratase family protein [Flavisolibacter sp.]
MILVTGGTGFLGAYIIKNLVEKGHAVRAIRRSSALPFFIAPEIFDRVEWVEGDVLDPVSLDDAMHGIRDVIHAAAIVSFSKHDRKLMYQVNVEGTANVVNAALDRKVQRFVHISSVAALGRTSKAEMVSEEKKWEASRSNTHYAISKHEAEMHAWRGFAEGLEGAVLNPSTILGFGDWHRSSCAIFRNAYKEFPWYTNGVNGFVGVEDVAEAAVQILNAQAQHQKYIVNAENWSFKQLFQTIAEGFQKRPPHKEATKMMGEVAWRLEGLRSMIAGSQPLLTRETAKVAQSKTSFDNRNLLRALPGFAYTPLRTVIEKACEKYQKAMETGLLTL